jgi:hypothetical protein
MRRTLVTLLLAAAPSAAAAQRDSTLDRQLLPRDVRHEVADRWNGPNALRASDRLEIADGHEVLGNVSVQHGPLIIAGHVTGAVLAINSDVVLRPTAKIDGDLLVVGGEVDGRDAAHVSGSIRIYRQSLRYRTEDDRIVVSDDAAAGEDNWWRRLEHRHDENFNEVLRVVQAGPYNRVEGLPIELGPVISRRTPWGSVRLDANVIVRTGSSFATDRADFGHNLRTEVRIGRERAIGVGARLMNVVDPVESWQLSDLEVALAAFLARHDYRDYYQRHGGAGFITLYGARDISLTGSFGEERWSSRPLRNPFTLFNDNGPWRDNPLVDEGLFHLENLELEFDTRTDPDDPWAGWFLNADMEHGRGTIAQAAPTSTVPSADRTGVDDYTRGFFDFRRYNRLGPEAQLNMRVVLGGWLGGDPLPLERRLSVDGPGALPGFGFRTAGAGTDVVTCNQGLGVPGRPAECDRIALAQIEYRGDLRIDFLGDWTGWPHRYHSGRGDVQWVFFADAGRGWNVGQPDGSFTYGSGTLPSLSTFRSDFGLGLDFAGFGVYAAKALSNPEPVTFFVRLRHRF